MPTRGRRVRNARWILAAIGLELMACEAALPDTSARPAVARAPIVVDAGTAITDAPVDATPPELDEVDDPRPWVYRVLRLGMAIRDVRATSILRRAGDRASLRVIIDAGRRTGDREMPVWTVSSGETFVGTVHHEGRQTVFDLSSAEGKSLKLTCRADRLAVHRAGAMLVPDPRYRGECSPEGVWRPSRTQAVDVWACSASEYDVKYFRARFGRFVPGGLLAPAPGVEAVSVHDDCNLQGGGYRRGSATD